MHAEHAPGSPAEAAQQIETAKWQYEQYAATEEREAEELRSPSGSVVYQAIFKEGESELERNNTALAWSGIAAGLSMGFSAFTESIIRAGLPESQWAPLIARLDTRRDSYLSFSRVTSSTPRTR